MSFDGSKGIGCAFWAKMVEHAEKIAHIDGLTGQKETYDSLRRRSTRAALAMQSRGVTSSDIVIICSFNSMDACVSYIAAQLLGTITSALDPTLSLKDVVHLLKQVAPKLLFVMPESLDLIQNALKEIGRDTEIVVFGKTKTHTPFSTFLQLNSQENTFLPVEILDKNKTGLILFSSGTTGFPKGICISNINFLKNCRSFIDCGFDYQVVLYTTSLYWITANLFLTKTILTGNVRIILPTFDAGAVWRAIDKYKVTYIFAPAIQLLQLPNIKNGFNGESIKQVLTGGVRLFPEHGDAIISAFPNARLHQIYGLTETGMVATFRPNCPEELELALKYPTSTGRFHQEFRTKIVDLETEEVLGPNQRGELLLTTDDLLFNGYFNLDSSYVWDKNGWFMTGDVGYFNEDGCFFIVDRVKDLLKYQSWHVAPATVEQILIAHPAVDTCLVIGIPHKVDGDHIMAVVVLKKDHSDTKPEELKEFVDERVDDRKKLRGGVRIIQKFPVSSTGKIKRKVVRDMILSGQL